MNATLSVPGATLYHEVRGTGPVLLLITGGIMDAAAFGGLAAALADRYTVVTYDRRGNSRSPLDGPAEPQRVTVHADDAHRLLAAVTDEPAHVFGVSSGAMIGLELAARHPGQVRRVVAHEPPVLEFLPDAGHWREVVRKVEEAYRAGGAGAAMGVFGEAMGMGEEEPAGEPTPELMEMFGRMEKNMDFFAGYEVPGFSGHVPDVAALRGAGVVVLAGAGSVGEPPHRAAHAVAERLGTEAVTVPGGHGGFGLPGFAGRLAELLG
ncbi:alpha/beta fold hydrolase [Actinomadura macrotermitis]|uniref:Putative hydrolase n=1 Tax=Actinomadura macrotermitis TaxID=2585200 RepID=A0A7K0BZF7_9ACTN|nr:alpha/beta fold hydrolase [Actinomadura macrotermitis]MQY06565.1 putative hydrolase [Actinomadura macrotermitis]